MVEDIGSAGGYACVETGTYGTFLYFPLNFAVYLKLFQK